MYKQILSALRAKFPGMQAKLLERVAKVLSKTVTEEDKVQDAVDGAGELVAEMADFVQKEGDRRANEAVKKHIESQGNDEDEDEDDTEPPVKPSKKSSKKNDAEVPEWAKGLIESNKQMAEQLASYKAQNTAKTQAERISGIMKEKNIPASFYKHAISGRTFKDDAELEAFAGGLEESWGEHQQELSNQGLSNVPPPVLGGTNKDGVSSAVAGFVASKTAEKASDFGGKKL